MGKHKGGGLGMTYTEFSEGSYSTGIAGIFQYLQATVPIFIPALLMLIFAIGFFASYYSQLRRIAIPNPASSFVAAGVITTISALTLSFIPSVVAPIYLIISAVVTLVGFLWLLSSQRTG